jgi:calcineurin-like phosphoesterase family protein
MINIFIISDTHFGHANFLNFRDAKDEPIRRFASCEEMDQVMIERWNDRIRPADHVYHLGDVCFGKATVARVMPQLNGHKRLCLGNHDEPHKTPDLLGHFGKIGLWRIFRDEGLVLSHLPLREDEHQMQRPEAISVHGHIHERPSPSLRHINVCVERTGYAPVHLDELMVLARQQREKIRNGEPA